MDFNAGWLTLFTGGVTLSRCLLDSCRCWNMSAFHKLVVGVGFIAVTAILRCCCSRSSEGMSFHSKNVFFFSSSDTDTLNTVSKGQVKVKVWTVAIAPLTWVRLVISSALQSRKWQLMAWANGSAAHYPLPALTDNWTHGEASRHTIAPISHQPHWAFTPNE